VLIETVPPTGEIVDPETDAGAARLRELYALPGPEYVRLNMITSLTGAAVGADGTSETLTSPVDRRILGVIRAAADVVLVGAQTVRAEGYVVPRRTRLAILTSSGELDGHRLRLSSAEERDRVLVLAPAASADAVRTRVGPSDLRVVPVEGDAHPAPSAVVAALHSEGLSRIVCEGGPSLATQFAAAGAVDEYCITVAPVLEPTVHPFLRLEPGRAPRTRVVGQLADDTGFTFLRLRPSA